MGTVRNILSALLNPFGFQIVKDSDWKSELRLGNKNPAFLRDDRFLAAYRRGVGSGHQFGGGRDPKMEWRTAVCCWAAMHARRLQGDFVECGTNTGILSLAVCDYIDFNSTGKRFYLFDTYEGIPTHQVVDGEDRERVASMNANFYFDCYDLARKNFSPYPNAILVKGLVPDSLAGVEIGPVAYLSIDMNLAYPERAAIEYFWPKLVTGAVVVLDDYAFRRHEAQKAILDDFAGTQNVEIWSLPTGQGLLIKP